MRRRTLAGAHSRLKHRRWRGNKPTDPWVGLSRPAAVIRLVKRPGNTRPYSPYSAATRALISASHASQPAPSASRRFGGGGEAYLS